MRDFDYEVLQRKRIAQQAKHKKKGSKTRKCSLPSDYLTAKQIRERNGEVMTYNINKPMSWELFTQLSTEIQTEYLSNLQQNHGGTQVLIAKMFGIGTPRLRTYMEEHGVQVTFKAIRLRNDELWERRRAWEKFMGLDNDEELVEEAEEPETLAPAAPAEEMPSAAPERKVTMSFDRFTLNFSGPFDREALCNSLAAILQNGQQVIIEIRCEMGGC